MSNRSTESQPASSPGETGVGSSSSGGAHTTTVQPQAPSSSSSEQSLEPFYEQLLKLSFPDSVTAIEHCRDLCAQFGFTVKQEASTHRNIYVYCSREGLPDSLRNPKSNPQRKRPSKRCDCRWRVVLYEKNGHWEFRKSQNPEASKHNHELMRPEEIDRNWPKKVIDLIYELARTNLQTGEIRAKVQAEFPDISWNERRFYNRLSEERQKIRQREAASRAKRLTRLWARLCMAAAGNEDLSDYVEKEVTNITHTVCQLAKLDPQSLPDPLVVEETQPEGSTGKETSGSASVQSRAPADGQPESSRTVSQGTTTSPAGSSQEPASNDAPKKKGPQPRRAQKTTASAAKKAAEPPKGFITVDIPKHTYFVKTHSQRVASEIQLTRNPRRQRTISTPEDASISEGDMPARKLSRKGKHSPSATAPGYYAQQEAPHFQQAMQPNAIFMNHPPHMQHQAPSHPFVYHTGYVEHGMPIPSAIPSCSYAPRVQYNFPPPNPGTFGAHTGHEMLPFDPSSSPSSTSTATSTAQSPSAIGRPVPNEPTIHHALHPNPLRQPKQRRSSQYAPMYSPGGLVRNTNVYQLSAAAAAAAAVAASASSSPKQDDSMMMRPGPPPPIGGRPPPPPAQGTSDPQTDVFMRPSQPTTSSTMDSMISAYRHTEQPPGTPLPHRHTGPDSMGEPQ